jgi:hypothetical protein
MAQQSEAIVSRTNGFEKRSPTDGMVGDARKRYEENLGKPCECAHCCRIRAKLESLLAVERAMLP